MRFRDAAQLAGCTAQKHSGIKDLELNQRKKGKKKARKASKQKPLYRFKAFSIEVGTLKLKGLLQSPRLINTRNKSQWQMAR